jgi:hypothetical protein
MNLEAGEDWKMRLWATLGQSRFAVIDISDVTPFVRDEVRMAVRRLGVHRILFVSDGRGNPDDCRRVTDEIFGTPYSLPVVIPLVVWSKTAADRAAFIAAVRTLVARLPRGRVIDDEPPPPDLAPARKNAPARLDNCSIYV